MSADLTEYDSFRRSKYFPSLDGLRCLSILAVIWHHALPEHFSTLAKRGGLGVELFFVISGFLITTLLLREREDKGQISLKGFYLRRTLRIFPLYYAAIGLFAISTLLAEADGGIRGDFFYNLRYFLTYTSNWFVRPQAGKRVIMILAWSLATEEQFYVVWPPIVRLAARWWIPLATMCSFIAVKEGTELYFHINPLGAQTLYDNLPVIIVRSIATPICLGCLLAYALHHRRSFAILKPLLGRIWSAPALVLIMLAVCLYPWNLRPNAASTPDLLVFLSMTMVVGACCIQGAHPLRAILGNALVRYIGMISYGLYLLHMFAIHAVRRILGEPFQYRHELVNFLLVTAIAVGLASLSYWTYEAWFLRLKDRVKGTRLANGSVTDGRPKGAFPLPVSGKFR